MKLTGQQIFEMERPIPGKSRSPLRELIESDLPASLSLRIARLVRAIDAEFEGFEQIRVRLVKKHGTVHPGSGATSVPPENLAAFAAEWNEAVQQEVQVKAEPIRIGEAELQGVKLSPITMLSLEPAVQFGEAEAKKPRKPKH
jgi:hypothetical protein